MFWRSCWVLAPPPISPAFQLGLMCQLSETLHYLWWRQHVCHAPRGLDESLLPGHVKKYLNNKWILLVLLAQLAPLKWRGEDKTELIQKTAQCSYLNCFHTWANEVSKYKYFYLLKQSILLGCYPRWTWFSWSRIKSHGYCLKFYRLQENISVITGRSCLNLVQLLLERPGPDVPKAAS